jgi:hypothetical protein
MPAWEDPPSPPFSFESRSDWEARLKKSGCIKTGQTQGFLDSYREKWCCPAAVPTVSPGVVVPSRAVREAEVARQEEARRAADDVGYRPPVITPLPAVVSPAKPWYEHPAVLVGGGLVAGMILLKVLKS